MTAYERRWPIGTRQRVWLDVLAYTGLRRGDAVRLGRPHVRDGVASIKTEKSEFRVTVTLPILPVLAATLAAGPCGELTFIAGAERAAVHQRVLRQPVPRSLQGRRRSWIGARCSQDRGDTRCAERSNSRPARSHLRMERRHHGDALHPRSRPGTSRQRSDAQAGER